MLIINNEYAKIIISTITIYLFIVISIRLFGKTEVSQLSIVDLVFILLISNSVQNAMVGSNSTLSGGLIAAGSLFLANYLFKQILYHFPKFGRFVQGDSLMLIYKGKLIRKNVEKAKLTADEIMEAIREHGVSTIAEVDLAVLEVDGNISVLSNEFNRRTVHKVKKTKGQTQNHR